MKKTALTLLALLTAASLCACTANRQEQPTPDADGQPEVQEEQEGQFAGMVNPITEYESLDEINAIVGGKLIRPGVMGLSDEAFRIIDAGDMKIAEYDFTVNGVAYTMRNASVLKDISGYYVDGGTAFGDEPAEDVETLYLDEAKLCRWYTLDGQYVLMAKDEGVLTEDQFNGICEEMRMLTAVGLTDAEKQDIYAGLAGSYQDSVGQRAVLVAEETEGALKISVTWSDSATEMTEWNMTATMGEDGLLSYDDCVRSNIVFDEAGDGTVETVYENGIGFFGVSENAELVWNGAQDEECQECVFAKLPMGEDDAEVEVDAEAEAK